MASPFCTACGATLAEGQRFCVKCGSAVGQAPVPAPPPVVEETVVVAAPKYVEPPPPPLPPPVPPPAPYAPPPPPSQQVYVPLPTPVPAPPPTMAPPPMMPPPLMPMPAAPVASSGPGAGLWIGLLGFLLLLGGAGLWFYTTRMSKPHPVTVETATSERAPQPQVPTAPAAPPLVVQNPATPEPAAPEPVTHAPPPSPAPKPEGMPPNPDIAKKTPVAPPVQQPPVPVTAPPVVPSKPTSGTLHAAVEVAKYGEVVFEGLPNDRLRLIFDHDAWQPTIHRQPNGTQTLVMRSLKQGIQRSCDVKWEIVQ